MPPNCGPKSPPRGAAQVADADPWRLRVSGPVLGKHAQHGPD